MQDLFEPIDVDALPWAEVLPGIEIRVIRVGPGDGYVMMLRGQPGATLPRHRHLGAVHAITHAGVWRYDEHPWVAGPGTYVHEPEGATHTFRVPDDATEPALITFVVEGPQELVDDDGTVASVEGGETILGYYRAYLDAVAAEG